MALPPGPKLGRDVAINVLPERFAQNERQAQVLPSLSHPNIASLKRLARWLDELPEEVAEPWREP